jgi:hypothetical protein
MNPELRRNLWLELTTHRLVAMPAVVFLVLVLFASRNPSDWQEAVFTTACGMFIVIVHLWGTYKASEAVTDEVRDRTWDWQRLSALDPWRMTWGKLAGATALSWYGGFLCVVAMAIALLGGYQRRELAVLVCGLIASGVAVQGAALAASLQASRKSSKLGHRVGLLFVFPLAAMGLMALASAGRVQSETLEWYGHRFESIRFYSALAVVFALWSVLGAYREMARELKMRLLPWAYPAFAVFLAVFFAGYAPAVATKGTALALSGFLVSLALTYYGLFADVTTAMSLRRIATHLQARHWRRAIEELPLWVTTLVLAVGFALWCAQILVDDSPLSLVPRAAALYPIAVLLLAVRDCGIYVFFALGARNRGPEGVTLLYMALLSWIVPAVLAIAGMGAVAKMLMPFGSINGWQAALVMAVHAAIAWSLAAWRWRGRQRAFHSERHPSTSG